MSEHERRVAAVNAVRDHFAGKAFELGKVDCVKVAAWHLRSMGHRLTGLAKAGSYKTVLGAQRALRRVGHDGLIAALDAMPGLIRIPPEAALPGDIIAQPGTGGMDALTIVMGDRLVLGFHEDIDDAGLQPIRLVSGSPGKAWRV